MAVVGIDLGTTHTVIAAVRDGRASALKDKLGRALLPSVVSFPPKGEAKIGYEGRDRRTTDPVNTVYSTKRLIGRPFESEAVRRALERFPFELKSGPGAATLVSCRGQEHSLPEISAMVLQASRSLAEARLGSNITDAVITVPAHFNDLQRAATKLAGKIAGLEVLRILNEPTAAALAYGFGKKGQERIAIYDFGGGTFDITILDLAENVFEVLATAGDTFLGGDDIDRAIAERMAEELQKKNKIDATNDPMVTELLRVSAEKLKLDLSTRSLAKARIEDLSFDFSMRRAEFEQLAEPFVTQSLAVCKGAMETAGIENKELQQVLLVGGSTRIPLVRRRISSFFNKMPQSRINPDEVVAIGAALQANALTTQQGAPGIPAAPIPRASGLSSQRRAASLSRPPNTQAVRQPAVSTQVGLAGLKGSETPPSSIGQLSEKPPQTLSGVGAKSAGIATKTLSGTGDNMGKTLAGVGVGVKAPAAPTRNAPPPPRRNPRTSLTSKPAPALEKTSLPPEGSEFEDITSVYPDGLIPQILGDKQSTLPGLNQGAKTENEPPEDGSVVFDLAELEAQAEQENLPANPATGKKDLPARPEAEQAHLPAALETTPSSQEKEQLEVDSLLEDISLIDEEGQAEPELTTLNGGEFTNEQTQPNGRVSRFPLQSGQSLLKNASQLADASDSIFEDIGRELSGLNPPSDGLSESSKSEQFGSGLPGSPIENSGLEKTLIGVQPPGQAPVKLTNEKPPQRVESSILEDLSLLQDSGLLEDEEAPPSNVGREKPKDLRSQLGEFSSKITPDSDDYGRQPLDGQEEITQSPPAPLRFPQGPEAPQLEGSPNIPGSPTGTRSPLLIDVTPLSLGVEVTGGYVEQLLEKGTPIPTENTRIFATTMDQQTEVKVRVCQGDSHRFANNTILGEVVLGQLGSAPRGQTTVEIIFALDESGVLNVSAKDPATGVAQDAQLRLIGLANEA